MRARVSICRPFASLFPTVVATSSKSSSNTSRSRNTARSVAVSCSSWTRNAVVNDDESSADSWLGSASGSGSQGPGYSM
jgi:hypothetical protein